MYVLYFHPFSQHTRRVVALLEEAGLDYRTEIVDLQSGAHMAPDYLAINPNHQVPTLVDGDIKIHESNAILRYLCVKHGLDDWYPSDLKTRAAVEQWLDWGQCRLAPAVIDIVFNSLFAGPRADKAAIARGQERLAELAPMLEAALEGRDYLTGDQPTIADLAVWANVFHLTLAKAAPETPNIAAWLARMSARPACARALPPPPERKSA